MCNLYLITILFRVVNNLAPMPGVFPDYPAPVLTHQSGWPARIAGPDVVLRRKAEGLVRELRTEIAKACEVQADLCGEPPHLGFQGIVGVRHRCAEAGGDCESREAALH
jgi:hypothetical protein